MDNGIAAPGLTSEEMRLLEKGVAEFNSGHYFECHDTLEELWMGIRGPARNFFQGLIQIAVGFYHLNQRNLPGCESQLNKGLQKLVPYGDFYAGVELESLRRQVQFWLNRIHDGELFEETVAERPRWRLTL
jgi:predicted metal-dependent hydrolase